MWEKYEYFKNINLMKMSDICYLNQIIIFPSPFPTIKHAQIFGIAVKTKFLNSGIPYKNLCKSQALSEVGSH